LLETPLRFFRVPFRFVVLSGFGTALLGVAVLESACARWGARVGRFACVLTAAALLATRGTALVGEGLDEVEPQTHPIYDAVREAARAEGPGPLLELPLADRGFHGLEREAMLGSTRHWLPLVSGLTGYPPFHRDLLVRKIDRLPEPTALDDLVDLTHVRWLLLRPADQWPDPSVRAGLLGLSQVRPVLARDGWDLLRVDREPQHPEWFAALAAGSLPGVPGHAQARDGP
jgi:hypothetical protein